MCTRVPTNKRPEYPSGPRATRPNTRERQFAHTAMDRAGGVVTRTKRAKRPSRTSAPRAHHRRPSVARPPASATPLPRRLLDDGAASLCTHNDPRPTHNVTFGLPRPPAHPRRFGLSPLLLPKGLADIIASLLLRREHRSHKQDRRLGQLEKFVPVTRQLPFAARADVHPLGCASMYRHMHLLGTATRI